MKIKGMTLLASAIALPIVSLGLFGFSKLPVIHLRNTPANQITRQQVDKVFSNVGEIDTQYGAYIRTNTPNQYHFSTNQIAHSKTQLDNPHIKEIILPYGTFVLTNHQGQIAHDKAWGKMHKPSNSSSSKSTAAQ